MISADVTEAHFLELETKCAEGTVPGPDSFAAPDQWRGNYDTAVYGTCS
jgi:hypothetical protein